MSMKETLYVTDGRDGKRYEVPINHNAVRASDLAKIQMFDAQVPKALRVVDESLKHIAVGFSQITLLDANKGHLYYRGYDVASILGKKKFEEVCHCLIWGDWPSSAEAAFFAHELAASTERPPQLVLDVVQNFP